MRLISPAGAHCRGFRRAAAPRAQFAQVRANRPRCGRRMVERLLDDRLTVGAERQPRVSSCSTAAVLRV